MTRLPTLERPTKEQIAALPPYQALPLSAIHVVSDAAQLAFAEQELRAASHVGFDTESKPIFVAGTPQTGPHLVQFATLRHAFLFQTAVPEINALLCALIASDALVKVGFGLDSDRPQIQHKLGIRLGKSIDVSFLVRRLGYAQAVGIKTAAAIVLGQCLPKGKATTSNWAAPTLSPQQMQYAANDAHASLLIYRALSQ